MKNFSSTLDRCNWFREKGPNSDIILSSRLRLARNIQGYPFPHKMDQFQKNELYNKIEGILADKDFPEPFIVIKTKSLDSIKKDLLFERKLITKELCENESSGLAIHQKKNLSIMIMENDHLHISTIRGGNPLKDAYNDITKIDKLLEKHLEYAVSLKWGYHTASLKDSGTGLGISLLVHLPALELSSIIDESLKLIIDKGLEVKCYKDHDNSTLASLYEISNKWSIGFEETSFIDNFHALLIPLLSLERKIRDALIEKKESDLRERIERSLDILKYSKSLSSQEALNLLSTIRLGITLGLVKDISLEQVTSLLILSQKSHVEDYKSKLDVNLQKNNTDSMRAKLIRDIL